MGILPLPYSARIDAINDLIDGFIKLDGGMPQAVTLANIAVSGSASDLTSGTLADARLSSNVPLKNAASNVFTGAMTLQDNLTVGTGIPYGTAFTGRITASQVRINPSGVKALNSYSDSVYAGWINNSTSVGEYWYLGNGGHYFGNNGANQLTVSTTAATFSGTIQVGGVSGPLLKNSSGTLQVRNSADSAFSNIRALRYFVGTNGLEISQNNYSVTLPRLEVPDLIAFGTAVTSLSRLIITPPSTTTNAIWIVNQIGQTEASLRITNNAGVTSSSLNADGGATFNGAVSVVGNTILNGQVTFRSDIWHRSLTDTVERSYYAINGPSYYKGAGTGIVHEFRNNSNTALARISNEGELRVTSAIAANNASANVAALGSGIAYYGLGHTALYTATSGVGPQIYLGDSNFGNSAYWNSAPGIGAVGGLPTSELGFFVYTGNVNSRTEAGRFKTNLGLQIGGTVGNILRSSGNSILVRNSTDAGPANVIANGFYGVSFVNNTDGTMFIDSPGATQGDMRFRVNAALQEAMSITYAAQVRFRNANWHGSIADGLDRFLYVKNGGSIYKGHGAGIIHEWRDSADAARMTLGVGGQLTLTGSRPIVMTPGTGVISVQASTGGWANDLRFLGSGGTHLTGFGAYGGDNTLSYAYIGTFAAPVATFLPSGNVGIGNTNPTARLEVSSVNAGSSTRIGFRIDSVRGTADTEPHIRLVRTSVAGWNLGQPSSSLTLYLDGNSANPEFTFAQGAIFVANSQVKIGNTTGVRLKNSVGVLQFRNDADSAFANLEASVITSAFQTLSADPTTADLSAGQERLVKNTTSGQIRRFVNDGGTIKKSPEYTI